MARSRIGPIPLRPAAAGEARLSTSSIGPMTARRKARASRPSRYPPAKWPTSSSGPRSRSGGPRPARAGWCGWIGAARSSWRAMQPWPRPGPARRRQDPGLRRAGVTVPCPSFAGGGVGHQRRGGPARMARASGPGRLLDAWAAGTGRAADGCRLDPGPDRCDDPGDRAGPDRPA